MGAYDPQGREIVLALARVLRHVGVTFGVLRKEKCTGDPARRLGNDLAVHAGGRDQHRNAEGGQGRARWCRSARIACAPSATDWQEYGRDVRDRASQRIAGAAAGPSCRRAAGRAREGRLSRPCYLGRYRDVYDEPREVIAQYGERGGAGALARALVLLRRGRRADVPGRGEGQARERRARGGTGGDGAQVVGTACPFCQTMFRDALGTVTQTPPKLLDIAQIAAASLPPRRSAIAK